MFRRFRFGFLSLFATMLLAVSAAGWWKYHSDLYVEEVEALQTLRKAGVAISVSREKSGWAVAEDEQSIPWNAPLIGPLETLYVEGSPTPEQRRAALTLPRLKVYHESPTNEEATAEMQTAHREPSGAFDVAAFLGSELPPLEEPTLPFEWLDLPLPNGEPANEREQERIARAIFDAWRSPNAKPPRYLIHSQTDDDNERRYGYDDARQLLFQSGDRAMRHRANLEPLYRETAALINDGFRFDYSGRGEVWARHGRVAAYDDDQFDEDYRNFPDDAFPYHGLNFHNWRLVERTFDAMPQFELDRVEKVDDVRYRVDFASFVAQPNDDERSSHAVDPKVVRWECVLRSDLDWAPEEALLVQAIQYQGNPKPDEYERRLVQRFRRQDSHVLITERLLQDRIVGTSEPARSRTRYATDLDPVIAEKAFEPATLDPVVWPEPRPLPVWRWYRVTFAISLALFAFLIGRSVAEFFRRKPIGKKAADAAASANDVRSEDDSAVASTPGA